MAVQWFYGASHAKLGPFSATQLRELKALGRLQPTDMVWKEGVKNGMPAGAILGLFGSIQPNAVVTETADLPIHQAAPEEAVVLPVATHVRVAAKELVQEIILEGLTLQAIPDERELALPAAPALLAIENPSAPIAAEPEPPPVESSAISAEPKQLAIPVADKPRAKPAPVRMKRAIAESGAIIVSQDVDRVRFRKKCVRCGFEESTHSVMRLMPGSNRFLFFCPKCRKQVGVSIRAV
ncbi:MAG TPA: DUF4339 domain-containing protein [Gemmataceae bacterium]|jgi:hypothetical protein|nr:DUF4339 domain-containing protein [Gemmataceae bacterium]